MHFAYNAMSLRLDDSIFPFNELNVHVQKRQKQIKHTYQLIEAMMSKEARVKNTEKEKWTDR